MKKIIISLILFIFLFCHYSYSQISGGSLFDMEMMKEFSSENLLEKSMTQQKDFMPVGNIVKPEHYYVGPGDILMLHTSASPISQPLMVNPMNSLLIPRIGEVMVENKTLAELNDTLTSIYKQWNPNAFVKLSLYKARICLVTIQGNVLFPSTYTMPSTYKVSTAILFANQIQTNQVPMMQQTSLMKLQENERERERIFSQSGIPHRVMFSRRNITVLHKDGSSTNVDLEKAMALNDDTFDPYLREGDIVYVPYETDNFARITISGAVNRPTVVPFKKGDMASYLLKFGYGLDVSADLDNIYLNLPVSNRKIKLKVDNFLNLLSDDIELEPGSSILVGTKQQTKKTSNGIVSVQGEVNNPGIYLIDENSKIKDVVNLAGGLKNTAYLPLAQVLRRDDNQISVIDYRREAMELYQYSNLVPEDTARYYIDMQYKKPTLSVNFVKLYNENVESENALLMDGDIIIIPNNPRNVYVFGQVNKPGFVDFSENRSMEWYINKAGGYAANADYKRASIIRGNNKVWVDGSKKNVYVYSGDMIYVPNPPAYPPSERQARYGFYSSILGTFMGALGLILTIINVSKR